MKLLFALTASFCLIGMRFSVSLASIVASDAVDDVDFVNKAWETSALQINGSLQIKILETRLFIKEGVKGDKVRPYKKLDVPKTVGWRSRTFLDNGRSRVEAYIGKDDLGSKSYWTGVWDGERWKSLEPGFGIVADKPGGGNIYLDFGIPYQYTYQLAHRDYSFSKLIRDRDCTLRKVDRLLQLTAPGKEGVELNLTHFVFWLDPDKGMLPVRWERGLEGQSTELRVENELAEVIPGMWAPIRSTVETLLVDQKSDLNGTAFVVTEQTVDRSYSRFGEQVDSSLFALEFPSGMKINDRIRGITYISGQKDVPGNLESLAIQGRVGLNELNRITVNMGPPARVSRWGIHPLFILNGILVAMLAFAYSYLRLRRKKTVG